jgi:chorismate mutase/prephenate dehydratase
VTDRFEAIRQEIDARDRELIAVVNSRLELVHELWQLKRERSLDQVDPGREAEIRSALAAANSGPLSPEGLDELVTEILALTKREMGRADA